MKSKLFNTLAAAIASWGVGATCVSAAETGRSPAPEAKCAKDGVVIAAGSLGNLTLVYPAVNGAKPESVEFTAKTATLHYKNGGVAKLEQLKPGVVSFWFTTVPGGIKDYKFDLQMPMALGERGAKWAVKDKSGVFPKEHAGPKLYQGNAGDFSMVSADGRDTFAILMPESFAWTELQDLRAWNWPIYLLSSTIPFNRDKKVVSVAFGADATCLAAAASAANAAFFAKQGGGSSGGSSGRPASPRPTLSPKLTGDGLSIGAGSMGSFKISYPVLNLGSAGDNCKPVETRLADGAAKLKYKNGGEVTARLQDGEFTWAFDVVPSGLKSFHNEMFIPFNYKDGGAWDAGEKSGPFPPAKVPGGKLYQGHSRKLSVTDVNKSTLAFQYPANTYLEVQDNREWGWNIFYVRNLAPFNPGVKTYSVGFSLDASQFSVATLLDRFGQVPRDFPGKIKDEAELKADVAADEAYYASFREPRSLNAFGGLAGSGERLGLKKTGFFHVEDKGGDGRDLWVLVDPAGDAFFHLGVCGFSGGDDYTNVEGRHDAYAWLPPHDEKWGVAWKDFSSRGWWSTRAVSFYTANLIRKYDAYDPVAMAKRHVARSRAVGFNSIGAFTGVSAEMKEVYAERAFPRVASLHYGDVKIVKGVRGVFDPFDPATAPTIDKAFSRGVAENAGDPLLIGYFLANEQGFEDIPRGIPALDKSWAAKRELVRQLEGKYGDIAAFNKAWALDAKSFDELEDRGLPLNTKEAFADMQAYNEVFLEAYFKVIHDTFRKHDPNHMLLGNRWQPGTANAEPLCRIAGKYNDIISINYYASAIDKAFVARLYNWSGRKPQFWSEFYFTSTQESNCGPSGHDLATQRERGLAYRNYVEQGASLGFLVGVEWFLLLDQSATGRFFEGLNGERGNTGLFNVADRPYKDMLAEMRKSHDVVYDVWLDGAEPFAFDDPRYRQTAGKFVGKVTAGRPVAAMAVDGKQDGYPLRPPVRIGSERLVSGRDANGLEASFKTAWDDDNLYVLVSVSDKTPMMNRQSPSYLWNADCVELFIGSENLDQGGAMLFTDRQILLGAGEANQFYMPNVPRQPAIRTAVVPKVDGSGYDLEAAIPWRSLDIAPKAGQTLLFDIGIDNSDTGSGRTAQLMWNGGARNSGDRSYWGRMILVP
ncbi:MAG: sugar-binding protein [Kiritimatiellia bacterium]|jgi:hypothetical protein